MKSNIKQNKSSTSSNWKVTLPDGGVILRPKDGTSDETIKVLKAKGYKVEEA